MAQRYIGKYVGDTPAKRKFQRKTKDDTGNNTIQVGDSGTDGYILQTTSAAAGNDLVIKAGDSKVLGTNGAGGDLLLYSGRGTGSAEGGEIKFYTFPAGVSGTAYNGARHAMSIGSVGSAGGASGQYIAGSDVYDFSIRSNGNMNFHIDYDNNETSQSFSFKNYTTEIANLSEAGTLQLDGNIELGHATDTTIARSAAGKVTIEGARVLTVETIHINMVGGNTATAQDYVGYGGHYNFNVAAGALSRDNSSKSSKGNNWSTKWSQFRAMEACTITAVKVVYSQSGNYDGGVGFFSAAPNLDGTGNLELTHLFDMATAGNASSSYVQETSATPSASLAAGEQLIITHYKDSATAGQFFGELTFQVQY